MSNLTIRELDEVSKKLKELGIDVDDFRLEGKIDLVQLNKEYDLNQRKSCKVMTFLEYVKINYADGIDLIMKLEGVRTSCFDRFLNINEDRFIIRNSKGHVVTQAQNFIYFILKTVAIKR